MIFHDPQNTISTCKEESCDQCDVRDSLRCHFTLRDLAVFLLICAPSFLIGGWGVASVSGWWLVPWLLIIFGYFCFVEIRVMCSHCPHYAESGDTLKCWANYGAPKLWEYRPGPMSLPEKFVFFLGFVLVWGLPVLFFVESQAWFWLFVYAVSVVGFFLFINTFLCTQCMNFACPLNQVDEPTREKFWEHNPQVARAWGKENKK